MTTATIRAIDEAARVLGGISDYRLAKTLGITQPTISGYRTGLRQLDDDFAVKVAMVIGVDPAALLAEIQAERSKSQAARAHWLRLAKMAQAACLVTGITAMYLATSGPSDQPPTSAADAADVGRIEYSGPVPGLTPRAHESRTIPATCDEVFGLQLSGDSCRGRTLAVPAALLGLAVLFALLAVWSRRRAFRA